MKLEEIFNSPKIALIVVSVFLVGLVGCFYWIGYQIKLGSQSAVNSVYAVGVVWPTISNDPSDKAYAELLSGFIKSNGGCELPCFMGIIPGKTTWESAHQALGTVSPSFNGTSAWFHDAAHNVQMDVDFKILIGKNGEPAMVQQVQANMYAEEMEAGSYYAQMFEDFLLARVLKYLGEPSQIFVTVDILGSLRLNNISPTPDYSLVLIYDRFGLEVQYSWKVEESGKQWKLCPGKGLFISDLSIYMPEISFSTGGFFSAPYYPLEQATSMNINIFYETFKDSNSQVCLKTPTRLWK